MKKVSRVVQDCLDLTSVKGIPRVRKHTSVGMKTFWLLSVLILGTISAYCVLVSVFAYLEFNSTTVILAKNIRDHPGGPPATTFCNLNPTSPSNHLAADVLSLSNYTSMVVADVLKGGFYGKGIRPDVHTDALLSHLASHRGYFQYIGLSNATKVGHQQRDFLIECEVLYEVSSTERGKVPCANYTAVRRYTTDEFFNCYTVHTNKTKVLADFGMPIGLTVILHLDNPQGDMTDFFDTSTDSTQGGGVRVSIHPPKTMPDLLFRPVDAPPGYFTNIHHNIVVRKRLGPPYDRCSEAIGNKFYVGMEDRKYPYTMLTCLNACAQRYVARQCECFDPSLLVTSSRDQLRLPYCAAYGGDLNETLARMRCATRAKEAADVSQCTECEHDCVEPVLPASTTVSVWPKKSQRLWFYRRMLWMNQRSFGAKYKIYETIWDLIEDGNETEARDKLDKTTLIEENFLKITSSLQSMEATILEDKPRNTITTLMSEIGGILNLYSGISLIVLIECLELMYRLLALPWGSRGEKYANDRSRDAPTADISRNNSHRL